MPSPKPTTTKRTLRSTTAAAQATHETNITDSAAALAVLAAKDSLIALARTDSSATALIPLITTHLLDPYITFARDAYATADAVLKKTPRRHFVIADTVFNGAPHARGLSEARVLLMDRVAEELAGKLVEGVEGGGVTGAKVQGWIEEGVLGEEMVREWLAEILEDMGGEGW